ncbi:symplekin [Ischnura elegans]|uniref:symplekin n=1 Tax=Ischnura elegans TaxID=197161 RepID=UPI001ED869B1|nr:symplekin [Ischnura elegans]
MARQDLESRRSTAAQFFMEEEMEDSVSSYKRIVDLLNQAAVANDSSKTDNLRRVQEIIVFKEPNLLDNFLDEMLGFQSDRNADVRKFVVSFIEEACKKDPDVLPKVVRNLQIFLQDPSAQVQKRVIQAATHLYRSALSWLACARTVTEDMESSWTILCQIKAQIAKMVDSDNDGIRTLSVKFLESVVLLQTYPEEDSLRRENDFSLEDIPLTLKIARRRKLEEEANTILDLLIKFHGSPHISSINLMTCMGTLTLIAKMRPQFMGKVVAALEMLHTNLPPTLSKSQVSSVRKHLKLQLFNLLKHPASMDYQTNITSLLTDLGATYQEIAKSYPKAEEVRKRRKRNERAAIGQDAAAVAAKKPRLEAPPRGAGVEEEDEDMDVEEEVSQKPKVEAIDVTERFVGERLTPDLASQLVVMAMSKLPETIPPHFSSTYTPISAAGTPGQIKHLARLIASQLTAAGLGPGIKQSKNEVVKKLAVVEDEDEEGEEEVVGVEREEKQVAPVPPAVVIKKPPQQRIKTLKLSEITKALEPEERERSVALAVGRILRAERSCATLSGVSPVRNKILTVIAAQFDENVGDAVRDFILEDLKNRTDLAFAWLYEEYSFMQGFSRMPSFLRTQINPPEWAYNRLLCGMIQSLLEKQDAKDRDVLISRLYLEAPLITEEATELLRQLCGDCNRASVGLGLLQELVVRRPPRHLVYLNLLLVYTAHEHGDIRTKAIEGVVGLYERAELRSIIEEYAIFYLGFLRLPQPPVVLFGEDRGRPNIETQWSEDIVKVCLYLYLALLPINENLIHELARVYVQTVADVKRVILRLLEAPVRGMGMDSPQLLTLVEECPKGAETLVTRVIHILTDKTSPSAELVARVRDLYHTRVSDVRFLIPVLNGLTKKEVMAALPRLIRLNPVVVKEVFNRLLGTHSEGATSPLTPAELLVALHNIDPSKADMKTIIKATSQCFAEKQVYTQEVLAVVMQQLMEQSPLPTLLMRTVIQSLSLYPRLIGFVMNILQRLILKQVWKQKKVWEGFIKCCQRTKPQSFQVLLQLPPAQLSDVFDNSPDLRQPLQAHVMALTENQRAHIPQAIMDVLMGASRLDLSSLDADTEPVSPAELTIDMREEENEDSSGPNAEPAPPGDED